MLLPFSILIGRPQRLLVLLLSMRSKFLMSEFLCDPPGMC